MLSVIANWDESRINDWIGEMLPRMESDESLIFHELPSTWVAWTLFRLDDPQTSDCSKRAQNAFCQAAHSLHGGKELQVHVDWAELCPLYEQLLIEVRAEHALNNRR